MRVLITGSRDWPSKDVIETALRSYHPEDPSASRPILVSGACHTGADAMAEQVAYDLGWKIERHPADWRKHKKAAGAIRNIGMVNLGADVCLAFIKNKSKGASMTADMAYKAGIKTIIVRMD